MFFFHLRDIAYRLIKWKSEKLVRKKLKNSNLNSKMEERKDGETVGKLIEERL